MITCGAPRKFHGMEYKGFLIPYCYELYDADDDEVGDDDAIRWPFCQSFETLLRALISKALDQVYANNLDSL
jgi:hypothetical protein